MKGGIEMPGMRELASHVIEIANRNSIEVTNLQLQKVMFFALGLHMKRNGIDKLARDTYDMPFEKWQYGPVVPNIYYTYNFFRDQPIKTKGVYSNHYSKWDETIKKLLKINVFDLVTASHKMKSWAKYKDKIIKREFVHPYSLEEIYEEFKK